MKANDVEEFYMPNVVIDVITDPVKLFYSLLKYLKTFISRQLQNHFRVQWRKLNKLNFEYIVTLC